MRGKCGAFVVVCCAAVLAGCGLGSVGLFAPDRNWPADGALEVLPQEAPTRAWPWLGGRGVRSFIVAFVRSGECLGMQL